MKLHRQFLLLHERYGAEDDGREGARVTLAEVAETLDCTHRSALTVIGKMAAAGWICWSSKRGRGRRSGLAFRWTPEDIAAQSVADAIGRGDIRGIAGELGDTAPPPAMQARLRESLRAYFGHHSETRTGRQIDTLRLPIRQQLHSLDPLRTNLLAESFVVGHVFDGLLRRRDGSDEILPALAHHWESGEEGTCWTFYLRKDVPFHDGRILTSEDVVYSFERMRELPERVLYGFMFRNIAEVTAPGPLVVQIRLKRAHTLFLPFLCTSRTSIVPKEALRQGEEEFRLNPIGTGPFRIATFLPDLCVLEAHVPHYAGRAHLDRVEIVNIPWRIEGGEDVGESDSPFHVWQGDGPNKREETQSAAAKTSAETFRRQKERPAPNGGAEFEEAWSRAHAEVFSRKFVTCNTKSGPLRDPIERAAVMAVLSGADSDAAASDESGPERKPLRLLTIPQYRKDAALLRERLESCGYSCRTIIVTVDDFKGRTRLAADLLLFSLIRDRDEQLRLFDLYLTLSEHADSATRAFIRNALRRAAAEETPRGRGRELDPIEARLVAERQLQILYETPLQTSYLPSIRGVSFGAQGWIDLRTVWFPPGEQTAPGLQE
ncbi:ABC transporter substrate-binding protein [Saccharibacillus qingshengii]|uniref:ABC transporter substrate-binding protein n=1 Tax=Saccharibacillus qingshengii TaxID=1763540 RepID=UPI001555D601|nr:ABC transporter substrate-binding protein [Saccharibacillus qingshengii]